MSQRHIAMMCLAIVSSAETSANHSHWDSPDYIQDSFVTIALGREYGQATSHLNKWADPIHFTITDFTGDDELHQRMVKQHLEHLSHITGLSITPSSTTQHANLEIIFGAESELETLLKEKLAVSSDNLRAKLLANGVCYGRISLSREVISHAIVIVPVDRARAQAKLMSCVVEELTQVLGLANDSDNVFPSIFNDRSHDDFLSGLDYTLLKLLYHPSLKPGMTEKQVREQLKKLLSTSTFGVIIEHAEQQVRVNSLENWLD